jgi:ATP-dependent DNA helicase RecG
MSRQPKSNGCLRIWADEVTVAKIRAGNSIIRNPILVSYIAKGLLPYRGLGSGIKRALDDWPAIDFDDDRDGNLFTATVHRRAIAAEFPDRCRSWFGEKFGEKFPEKFVETHGAAEIPLDSRLPETLPYMCSEFRVGPSKNRFRKAQGKQSRIRRIGPDKGGYWEVIA